MGGVFFCKNGPSLNAGCIMYSISIFYFTFYLFGGCVVRTHPHAPPACGPALLSLVPRLSTRRCPQLQPGRRRQISMDICRRRPGCGKAAGALWRQRQIWIERRLLSTGQTDGHTPDRYTHTYCAGSINSS